MNASKVIFVSFNLNWELHAVSVRKPSAQMSNVWTVRIFNIRIRISVFRTPLPCIKCLTFLLTWWSEMAVATTLTCEVLSQVNGVTCSSQVTAYWPEGVANTRRFGDDTSVVRLVSFIFIQSCKQHQRILHHYIYQQHWIKLHFNYIVKW